MKKLIFSILAITLIATTNAHSQTYTNNTCSSTIGGYTGPSTSATLTTFLNTSTNPAITALSQATKASLVTNMVFVSGLPIGMLGTDANIQALYANNANAVAVFSVILGKPTMMVTSTTKPVVVEITIAAFNTLNPSGQYTIIYSLCKNCYAPSNLYVCCNVGGDGCIDKLIKYNNTYYHVK
jgi:hypothetical protein